MAVPEGYRIEPVAEGLTFPSAVAFDASGAVHVLDAGYSYGKEWTTPRLVRVDRPALTRMKAHHGKVLPLGLTSE